MKTKFKIVWFVLVIMFLFTSQTFAMGAGQKHEDKIRIGAVLPLTGNLAVYGELEKRGIELALEDINKTNIIMDVFYEDSQGLPKNGVFAVNKLLMKDVSCIISIKSSVAKAINPILQKRQILNIMNLVSAPDITKTSKYFFRYHPTSALESEKMIKFIEKKGLSKKMGIIYSNDEYGVSGYKNLVEILKNSATIKIELADSYDMHKRDFKLQVEKFTKGNIDGIYVMGVDRAAATIIKQIRLKSATTPIFTSMVMTIHPFRKVINRVYQNNIYYTSPEFSNSKYTKSFINKYKMRYNMNPDWIAGSMYDIINILHDASKGSYNKADRIQKKLISHKKYHGLFGDIEINKYGDFIFPLTISKIVNGKDQIVTGRLSEN